MSLVFTMRKDEARMQARLAARADAIEVAAVVRRATGGSDGGAYREEAVSRGAAAVAAGGAANGEAAVGGTVVVPGVVAIRRLLSLGSGAGSAHHDGSSMLSSPACEQEAFEASMRLLDPQPPLQPPLGNGSDRAAFAPGDATELVAMPAPAGLHHLEGQEPYFRPPSANGAPP